MRNKVATMGEKVAIVRYKVIITIAEITRNSHNC